MPCSKGRTSRCLTVTALAGLSSACQTTCKMRIPPPDRIIRQGITPIYLVLITFRAILVVRPTSTNILHLLCKHLRRMCPSVPSWNNLSAAIVNYGRNSFMFRWQPNLPDVPHLRPHNSVFVRQWHSRCVKTLDL
uniref:Uncharacterized protein n=1 Tax=Schistocephalus solidus TaxID=70667 RepID=A0A0X3P265_SCHSO